MSYCLLQSCPEYTDPTEPSVDDLEIPELDKVRMFCISDSDYSMNLLNQLLSLLIFKVHIPAISFVVKILKTSIILDYRNKIAKEEVIFVHSRIPQPSVVF